MSKSRERREFPRVPFQMAATIRGDHVTVVSGDIRDVSLKGMFAAGAGRLPAGCRCQVELLMGAPGQEVRLSLRGRVTRVDSSGMGIEFLEMGLDALAQLNHLVQYCGSQAPPTPSGLTPTHRLPPPS